MAHRQSIGAAALIHRRGDQGVEWFARWNHRWECFHLVGGHKYENESFHDCMVRELGEELGVSNNGTVTVSDEPLCTATYTAWSDQAAEITDYTIALFDVSFSSVGPEMIASLQEVRWIREREIRAGVCDDGLPVSSAFVTLLESAGKLRNG